MRTARDLSSDLSETIEKLLLQYVEAEQRRLDDRERRIDAALALIEAHQAEHGLWGEEFSTV